MVHLVAATKSKFCQECQNINSNDASLVEQEEDIQRRTILILTKISRFSGMEFTARTVNSNKKLMIPEENQGTTQAPNCRQGIQRETMTKRLESLRNHVICSAWSILFSNLITLKY